MANNALEEVDHLFPDPAMFTSQHKFHHRHIHRATAEIDAAVAESFDLDFHFMWGQHEDTLAGLDWTPSVL